MARVIFLKDDISTDGKFDVLAVADIPSLSALYQALDGDLTTIAGLSPANDDFMQFKAGAWSNRTIAQVVSDLGGSFVTLSTDQTLTGKKTFTIISTKVGVNIGTFAGTPSGMVDGDMFINSTSLHFIVRFGGANQIMMRTNTGAAGTIPFAGGATSSFFNQSTNFVWDNTNAKLVITGSLEVSGGQKYSIKTVTATSYTAAIATDYTILANAASNAITINLPTAASASGYIFIVKKIDNVNNVTIDPNGSETIDGAATATLTTQNQKVIFQSNGTAWFILN